MADGLGYTPGSGAIVATDDIAGQAYQRIKLVHGADGTNAGDVATGNPLPVSLPSSQITALTPPAAITGYATDTNQVSQSTLIAAVRDRLPAALVNSRLAVEVPGTITESNSGSINGKLAALAGGKYDIRPLTNVTDSVSIGGTVAVSAASLPLPAGAASETTLAAISGKLPALTVGNKLDIRPLASGTDGITATGTVAHDAVDSGAPIKIGHRAVSSIHSATLVSDGDRSDAVAGLDGVPIVRPHATLDSLVSGTASNTDGAATAVLSAAGAGIKIYLTDVTIANTSGTNIYVEIKDGATTKWVLPVPANGGVTHRFGSPLAGTANTAWNFDPSAAASTIYCSASGFRSKI